MTAAHATQALAAAPDDGAIPEHLKLSVDQWFSRNTGLGGCSDKDVAELAAIFWGVHFDGGRESVEDALAVVESFGDGVQGLNDTFARQVLLASELKRMRSLYDKAVQGRQAMREALMIARDHISMHQLRTSHCKDAAAIEAALASRLQEQEGQPAPTDEAIRRLFVEHGHIYAGWLELGRAILALAAGSQAVQVPVELVPRSELDSLQADMAGVRDEADRTARNRDMWRGQCERQAAELAALRLTPAQRTDVLAAAFCIAAKDDETSVLSGEAAERIIGLLTELAGFDLDAACVLPEGGPDA